MLIKSTGRVIYDPPRPGMRKVRPGSFLIAEVDNSIAEYYRWWVKKRFGLILQNTAWKPHITVLDGRQRLSQEQMKLWKKYQGQIITFEYSVDIEQQWKFWCLPVKSIALDNIREEFGLESRKPFPFHITIGRME